MSQPIASGEAVADMGVEYDWMGFYYNLTKPGAAQVLSSSQLLDLYRVTCNQPTGFCAGDSLAWEDCAGCSTAQKGVHPRMQALQASNQVTPVQLQTFERFGGSFGVSRDTQP